jgi:hypothetical protein
LKTEEENNDGLVAIALIFTTIFIGVGIAYLLQTLWESK